MNTEEKLKEIFATTFNTQSDKITLQTKQNEFENWDSLGQLRLIMAVEEAFNVSFAIDEIASMTTFERILNKVIQKTGKK